MKLLCLHVDAFRYRFDHATEGADAHVGGENAEFGESLVVFLSVEAGDAPKADKAAKEVCRAAHLCHAPQIVVNPFVHLTAHPAEATEAHEVSAAVAAKLEEIFDGEIVYTSFGWYKGFSLDVRGDDHSQMFRHV